MSITPEEKDLLVFMNSTNVNLWYSNSPACGRWRAHVAIPVMGGSSIESSGYGSRPWHAIEELYKNIWGTIYFTTFIIHQSFHRFIQSANLFNLGT